MRPLNGPDYIPNDGKVSSLVIFLHGFGADGDDLISLAPFFASHLPTTAFHAPNGPEICETSPFGRQWFSLARYDSEYMRRQAATQEVAFEAMYEGACNATPILESYIQSLMDRYELTPDKVALIGFSQGTMMALHIGLRQQQAFAGIVGFSGALVGASHLKEDMTTTCPILLVHGEADEMLPVHAVDLAAQTLHDVNVDTQVVKRPALPHSIDEEGVQHGAAFLASLLNRP